MTNPRIGVPAPDRIGPRVVFVVAFCLACLRYLPFFGEPWDDSTAATNGWGFTQPIVRNWERIGLFAAGGVPHQYALPSGPGGAMVGVWPYLNHPPGLHWAFYAWSRVFGTEPWALRLLPLLASALAAGLGAELVRRTLGSAMALVFAVWFAVLPLSFYAGRICSSESVLLPIALLTLLLHRRWRTSGAGRYAVVHGLVFVAMQADWQGAFVPAMLVVDELLAARADRRWWRVLGLGLPVLASVAVTLLVTAQGMAGIGAALEFYARVFGVVATADTKSAAGHAPLRIVLDHLLLLVPWPVLLAAGVGLVAAARRGAGAHRVWLTLLVPGLANVLVFQRHAAIHDFWIYALSVPLVGLAVLGLDRCVQFTRRRMPRSAPWLGVLVGAAIAAWSWFVAMTHHAAANRPEWHAANEALATRLNDAVPADDLLVTDLQLGPVATMLHCHLLVSHGQKEALAPVHGLFRQDRLGVATMFCAASRAALAMPGLEVLLREKGEVVLEADAFVLFREAR